MPWPPRILRKKQAYLRLLLDANGNVGPDAAIVLADLRRFCHHDRSTLKVSPVTRMTDSHATMLAEGRREVFVRILGYLNLDDQQVSRLVEPPEE